MTATGVAWGPSFARRTRLRSNDILLATSGGIDAMALIGLSLIDQGELVQLKRSSISPLSPRFVVTKHAFAESQTDTDGIDERHRRRGFR
jgi:hypothetical protein